MKKNIVNDDLVEQLLRRFNPLGLRDRQGHPYEFTRLSELYLQVMVQVYVKFPRGYVETALLISTLYAHLSFSECRNLAESMESMGVEQCGSYEYEDNTGRQFFRNFLRALHHACETSFSEGNFAEAYRLLKNRIELEKAKKNGK